MTEHRTTVDVPFKEYERINRLLSIDCFEDLTLKEISEQEIEFDSCEGIFEAKFDDGSYVNWDLCSGQSNYYDDVNWYSADDKLIINLECTFEFDDLEFEINSELYIVTINKI